MIYVSFKADDAKVQEIQGFYQAKPVLNDPYSVFQAKKGNITIHAYKNRKGIFTITFAGPDDETKEEAGQFSDALTIKKVEDKPKTPKEAYYGGWEDLSYQIGSDEVGVGDFFGPLIVASTYITPKDIPLLEKLGVNDSKKMSDAYILTIGARLKAMIPNFVIMVSPKKLSALQANNFKIHKTMAKCHNLTHRGIIDKCSLNDDVIVYIDQFETEDNYRKHVGHEIVPNTLYFRTKGETYFPSVACASVIARYMFLLEWQKMEKDLGMAIPKGAGAAVDKVYAQLKKTVPAEKLTSYVKTYFRNFTSD